MKNIEEKVLQRLKLGTLTHLQALHLFGTYKLASYIERLRRKKFDIVTESKTVKGVTFGVYRLSYTKQK